MTATVPKPVLQLQQLHFAYPGAPALVAQWSHAVAPGVTWLHGDTGSGKTTLLSLLAGERTAGGRRVLNGVDGSTDAAAYRLGLFWHDPTRDDSQACQTLTAPALAARLQARYPGFDGAAWQQHLQGFGLGPHLAKAQFALSTGSRRKVWLAAALSAGCALTLLDEPTAGLDAASVAYLMQALAHCADCSVGAAWHGRATVVASGVPLNGVPLAGVIALPLP
jgi:ABC-2 type transport system ATP-binding protein